MSEPAILRSVVRAECPVCPYVSTARTVEAAVAVCNDHHAVAHAELNGQPMDWRLRHRHYHAREAPR